MYDHFVLPTTKGSPGYDNWREKTIKQAVSTLSPSRKRMLLAVLFALRTTYGWRESVNRLDIADQLKREKLLPWDIKVLRDLVKLRLVNEERVALPLRHWKARGAEYRYSIDKENRRLLIAARAGYRNRQKSDQS